MLSISGYQSFVIACSLELFLISKTLHFDVGRVATFFLYSCCFPSLVCEILATYRLLGYTSVFSSGDFIVVALH